MRLSICSFLFLLLLVELTLGVFVLRAEVATGAETTTPIYAPPFETPGRPSLLMLPAGAVTPDGWLRDWCVAARDGYTGHMDEVHVEFQRAWAEDHLMTGDRLNWPKGAWPYEGGGYWFDGLVRLGYILHDESLLEQAKRRLNVVVSHMHPNSIVFLWWLNKNSPEDTQAVTCDSGWPIWACGLLGRSMAAYYAASRDPGVLKALQMAYSGDPSWVRLGGGMSSIWPALQTYTWTGDKQVAQFLTARLAKENPDFIPSPPWDRFRRKPNMAPDGEPPEHGVLFHEATTAWALGYLWTGNREYLETSLAWHELLHKVALQPTGVPVADEYYGPTGAFRGTETCDVAGYEWSQIVFLMITGQGVFGDRIERAFFNAGPAVVTRDFKNHVYFQSPNRVVDGSPLAPHGPGASGFSYKPFHFPLCCTAALNRIVPNYVMHMWMATPDNGLAATMYGPCKVSALVADGVPVEIACQTSYPFDETITMTVQLERSVAFPLLLRIPKWCLSPQLQINGTAIPVTTGDNGFVRIERAWNNGDAVKLQLPMSVQLASGNDRNADQAPYVTVSYGPLLFALPIRDTDSANTPDPTARWKFALDPNQTSADAVVERHEPPAQWNWPLDAPVKIRVNAWPIEWNLEPQSPRLPLRPTPIADRPVQTTLVPYGCTKFRISMFPAIVRPSDAK